MELAATAKSSSTTAAYPRSRAREDRCSARSRTHWAVGTAKRTAASRTSQFSRR